MPKSDTGKKDMLDLVLMQERMYQNRKIANNVSQYPETVSQTLETFARLWGFTDETIPSKRMKSKYSQWIKELDSLNQLCGSRTTELLTAAFNKYDSMKTKFMIAHPAAIYNLVVDTMREIENNKEKAEHIKREQAKLYAESYVNPLEMPAEKASEEKVTSTLKSLEKFLQEDDE